MSATYDVLVKGGTVVNQDGVGVRDVGVRGGRIAAIGNLSAATAGEVDERAALAAYQAARDRLSLPLFDATDAIASQRWTDGEIGGLLLQASSAMADEAGALADLDTLVVR